MKVKVSVYLTTKEKDMIISKANSKNLTMSEFLRMKGLEEEIVSDRRMAGVLSIASQLYFIVDEIEDVALRQNLQEIGDVLYGLY